MSAAPVPALGLGAIGPLPLQTDTGELVGLRDKLLSVAKGTDGDVATCKSLPDSTKAAWAPIFSGWKDWDARVRAHLYVYQWVQPVHVYAMYKSQALFDEGLGIQTQFHDWQTKIQGLGCELSIPIVDKPEPPGKKEADWIKAIEIAAIAVTGVAAAVLLAPLVKEGAAALGAMRVAATKKPAAAER